VAKTQEKLEKLCKGVRAIGAGVEIRISPSEVTSDEWSVMLSAGGVIIHHTEFLPLDAALDAALAKLASISSRMMAAVKQASEPPPPPSPKKDDG
jgi:hypothetical protein